MEYMVKFAQKSWADNRPVHLFSRKIGYIDVRRIREAVGVPELSLERIRGKREALINSSPAIAVPEAQAERCEHFAHTCEVEVTVPGDGLNRFVREDVRDERSPETGEVVSARLVPVLDEAAVLAAWEAAGFPLEWNPAADETSEGEGTRR